MDSIVQGLLIISVPLDLLIVMVGAYFIKAYSHEQALIRQAAHDEQITVRENLRLKGKLVDSGQYQANEDNGIMDLIEKIGPQLLAKYGQQQAQPGQAQIAPDRSV